MSDFGKVIACLRELGLRDLSVDSFQDKLVVQKVVYLLQLKGVGTGFKYGLYVRGPYSPDLTRGMYAHKQDLEQLRTSAMLSDIEAADVRELRALLDLRPSLLEVAATYAYFAFERHQDPITAMKNVRMMKGFYPEARISVGISRAKQFLFEPTDSELEEMKIEHEPWERASLSDLENRPS